eukprot:gene14742-biopygen9624
METQNKICCSWRGSNPRPWAHRTHALTTRPQELSSGKVLVPCCRLLERCGGGPLSSAWVRVCLASLALCLPKGVRAVAGERTTPCTADTYARSITVSSPRAAAGPRGAAGSACSRVPRRRRTCASMSYSAAAAQPQRSRSAAEAQPKRSCTAAAAQPQRRLHCSRSADCTAAAAQPQRSCTGVRVRVRLRLRCGGSAAALRLRCGCGCAAIALRCSAAAAAAAAPAPAPAA